MAISNKYSGNKFNVAGKSLPNRNTNFGENRNRTIESSPDSTVSNSYATKSNRFGSASRYSYGEQLVAQNLVKETININGITVRYMARSPEYDKLWNEAPGSTFDKGFTIDMLIESVQGFEGEGAIIGNYGLELREEVILRCSIPRFKELHDERVVQYNNDESDRVAALIAADSELEITPDAYNFYRSEPLEGDLIFVPFGISALDNGKEYTPKVFEVMKQSTYEDVSFYQLGNNFQFRLHCRLFEISGENIAQDIVTLDDEELPIVTFNRTGLADSEYLDEEGRVNIVDDSDNIFDEWGDNLEIEQAANRDGSMNINDTTDYTARLFRQPGINLDDF